jgi:eukaryotic-like serine/threonine-protein kinase
VDGQGARILELFREPRRVVDAVMDYAKATGRDPQAVLAAAFPVIRDCCNAGFLVPAESLEATRIAPMLRRGDRVGRWRIVRCVQALEDVEVYQASGAPDSAAVKVLRPGAGKSAERLLGNEARVLRALDGRDAPRLIEQAAHDGRPYLVMTWCSGISPVLAAAELREAGQRERLLMLCCDIVDTYARLHARGVIHADVDSRNLLIAADGSVTILDFGLARVAAGEWNPRGTPRAGVGLLTEPECARAALDGRALPKASRAGDQYAVGVLLYALLTGGLYLDFALERRRALKQITSDAPLAFARQGTRPWPAVERVLRQALRKPPSDRFASLEAFGAALRTARGIPSTGSRRPTSSATARTAVQNLAKVLRRTLEAVDLRGPALASGLAPPTASLTFGAAGVAAALYRIACIRDDPRLLSVADVWLTKAEQEIGRPTAFYCVASGVAAEVVGTTTPFHTASGVHLVRALLALATSDTATADTATAAFIKASRGECPCLDLTLGRAGTLLACAILMDAIPGRGDVASSAVNGLGDATLAELGRVIGSPRAIGDGAELTALGMAHGWAGVLYAMMRWCASTGARPPVGLARRLDELAACAEPAGRGMRWAYHTGRGGERVAGYVAGWCNGSAGFVHLWTLAHRELGRPAYLERAIQSAWHAWEDRESGTSLCCFLTGRAYSLLNLYRHTGDGAWLERARALGARAAHEVLRRRGTLPYQWSLYKGDVGVAVLAADLEHPETACMPVYEEEGWPRTLTI